MERRYMHEEDCRAVYTLNTWTEDKKEEARKYLEEGYWVRFGSTCIGHTLAYMVALDGIEWAKKEYGDVLQVAEREGWGYIYCRLR